MKYVPLTGNNGDTVKLYIGTCHLSHYEEADQRHNNVTEYVASLKVDEVPPSIAESLNYNLPSYQYYIPMVGNYSYFFYLINKAAPYDMGYIDYNTTISSAHNFIYLDPEQGNFYNLLASQVMFSGDLGDTFTPGYTTTRGYNPLTYYQSNYTYIMYDPDLVRYKNINNYYGQLTDAKLGTGIAKDIEPTYQYYTGGIVIVSTTKPLEAKTYQAFRQGNASTGYGELANSSIILGSLNFDDYAFIQTRYAAYFENGTLHIRTQYNYGNDSSHNYDFAKLSNGTEGKTDVDRLYSFEKGIIDNLTEDSEPEPEPEPEPGEIGEGPMYGPIETGFITMYGANTGSEYDQSQLEATSKAIFTKNFLASISNYWNGISEGLINFQLYPLDLSKLHAPDGSSILGSTEQIAIYGEVPSGAGNLRKLKTEYVRYDCGTINITSDNYFYKHTPYTKASLFLPYCGDCPIDIDDFRGGYIHLMISMDLYNGNIVYEVYSQKTQDAKAEDMLLRYRFSGNMSYAMPLTGREWGQTYAATIQAAATTVASTIP